MSDTVYTYRIIDRGLLDDCPRDFAYTTETMAFKSIDDMVKAAKVDFDETYEEDEVTLDEARELTYVNYRLGSVGVSEALTSHDDDYAGPREILYWSMEIK